MFRRQGTHEKQNSAFKDRVHHFGAFSGFLRVTPVILLIITGWLENSMLHDGWHT